MTRFIRHILLILILCLPAGCSWLAKTDLDRFEGEWDAFEVDGPERYFSILVTGESLEFMGGGSWFQSRLKLNESHEPGRLELMIEDGPHKKNNGLTIPGIYQFNEDQLIIVLGEPGDVEYPKSFSKLDGYRVFRLKK